MTVQHLLPPVDIQDFQWDLVNSHKPIWGVIGGRGLGKTWGLKRFITKQALLRPDGTCAYGYPNPNQYEIGGRALLEREAPNWGFDWEIIKATNTLHLRWPLASGKSLRRRVFLFSLHNPDQSVRGSGLGAFAIDEARNCPKRSLGAILPTMREAKNPLLRLATSPNGFDWCHKFLIQDVLDVAHDPEEFARISAVRGVTLGVKTQDNRFLPAGFVEFLKSTLDPETYRQEVEGEFIQLGKGRVYHQFDRRRNVSESAEYDPRYPVLLGWDFNVLGSCVLLQAPAHDDIRVFDEVQIPKSWTPDVCKEILRRWWAGEFPPGHDYAGKWRANHAAFRWIIFGDASGHRGSSNSQVSDYAHIAEAFKAPPARFDAWRVSANVPGHWSYRTKIREADPSVRDRVNRTNALFLSADGRTRLRVHPRCRLTINDLENVVFKEGTGDIDKKVNPQLTHLSDGLGYALYELLDHALTRLLI